jgi:hypothetical protein
MIHYRPAGATGSSGPPGMDIWRLMIWFIKDQQLIVLFCFLFFLLVFLVFFSRTAAKKVLPVLLDLLDRLELLDLPVRLGLQGFVLVSI